MKSVKRSLNEANKHDVRRQRLLNKARRAHKKSSRLQKEIQRAVTKQNPDMSKINKWLKQIVQVRRQGSSLLG